jgi:hypothetical protein
LSDVDNCSIVVVNFNEDHLDWFVEEQFGELVKHNVELLVDIMLVVEVFALVVEVFVVDIMEVSVVGEIMKVFVVVDVSNVGVIVAFQLM